MKNKTLSSLKYAFPLTLPVLCGFAVLGIAYGVLMTASGFDAWLAVLISCVVYAGSMQFVLINILLGAFNPLSAFLVTLMVNARHLFYGISMLEKYKGMGLRKPYLIFALCDETFSINCSAKIPEGIDKGSAMTWVTILNQSYWVAGTALGAVFGSFVKFDTTGLDFCMTAMFIVILLEQLLSEKDHKSSAVGAAASVLCLLIFGAEYFMIPAMALILISLGAIRLLGRDGEKNE